MVGTETGRLRNTELKPSKFRVPGKSRRSFYARVQLFRKKSEDSKQSTIHSCLPVCWPRPDKSKCLQIILPKYGTFSLPVWWRVVKKCRSSTHINSSFLSPPHYFNCIIIVMSTTSVNSSNLLLLAAVALLIFWIGYWFVHLLAIAYG